MPHDLKWNYVGTLDNDATNTQILFLSKVAAANPQQAAAYRASGVKGIGYLLAAQYPNGGWPQVWPLEGGYHDAITINDGAMTETLETLAQAASGEGDFSFAPPGLRKRAADAVERGIECLLAAQVKRGGVRTAWAQQHDALTLEPVSARNYEPPALCASESAGVLLFLMGRKDPGAAVEASVRAAAAWLEAKAIEGKTYMRGPEGARLVDSPGDKPIWARFYSLTTGAPVFGDRDKTIHDNVEEISRERRNGYSWYNSAPQAALDRFAEWAKAHPARESRAK
jgi:PelA/Pel-15E family pectate lyase